MDLLKQMVSAMQKAIGMTKVIVKPMDSEMHSDCVKMMQMPKVTLKPTDCVRLMDLRKPMVKLSVRLRQMVR